MRRTSTLVWLISAGAACGGGGGSVAELGIEGTGLTALEGKAVHTAVWDTEDKFAFVSRQDGTVQGGAFRIVAEVDAGRLHRMDIYIDVDGDGVCTVGVDRTWTNESSRSGDDVVHRVAPLPDGSPGKGCVSWGATSLRVITEALDVFQTVRSLYLVDEADRVLAVRTGIRTQTDTYFDGTLRPGEVRRVIVWVEDEDDETCVGDSLYEAVLPADLARADDVLDVLEPPVTFTFHGDEVAGPSACDVILDSR